MVLSVVLEMVQQQLQLKPPLEQQQAVRLQLKMFTQTAGFHLIKIPQQ